MPTIAQQQYVRPMFYSADRAAREEKMLQAEPKLQYENSQKALAALQVEMQVSLTDLRCHYTYNLDHSKKDCLLRDGEYCRKLAKALRTVHNYFAYGVDHLPQDPAELSPKQLAKATRRQAKAGI